MIKPTIVHVNRNTIAKNSKDGGSRPVYRVEFPNGKVRYGTEVVFMGGVRAIQSKTPRPCGARVWIETEAPVVIHDECSYAEAMA